MEQSTLGRIEQVYRTNFSERGDLGAALSIWQDGHEVVGLAGGFIDREENQPWQKDTLVLIWSATKGFAAACVLHCLDQKRLSLETRVAELWPEFAQAGKEHISVGHILSHQAGLPLVEEAVSVLDHAAVVKALEKQRPLWPPGTAHGYHARTFGFLADELARRMSDGETLSAYWRRNFGEPLQLDAWIGLPENQLDRVSAVYPAKSPAQNPDQDFYTALADPDSFTSRVFSSPQGFRSVASMNKPEAQTASLPSFGGVATAQALAKFYAMLACGGILEGNRFFSDKAIKWMTTTLSDGPDRVLQMNTAFSAGFMKNPRDRSRRRAILGPSPRAFGHPGAGGAVAFADPENGIGFAYVMNQMELGVLPNEKSLLILDALYE